MECQYNYKSTTFYYALQLCIILTQIRQAFLIEHVEVEKEEQKIVAKLLENEAKCLKEFIHLYCSNAAALIENIKNIKFLSNVGDADIKGILVYCSKETIKIDKNWRSNHEFVGRILNYCGTYVKKEDQDEKIASIYYKYKLNDKLFSRDIMVFMFYVNEDEKCEQHAQRIVEQLSQLTPKIKFGFKIKTKLAFNSIKSMLADPSIDFKTLDPEIYKRVIDECINYGFNVGLFNNVEQQIFFDQQLFTPEKKGLLLFVVLLHQNDPFGSIYVRLSDQDRKDLDANYNLLSKSLLEIMEK